MDELTAETFSAHLHEQFAVGDGAAAQPLTLVEVALRGQSRPGSRQPFALLFHGPIEPVLPQAIYRFEHPALTPMDIFIVPVGPGGGHMRYEAIFT